MLPFGIKFWISTTVYQFHDLYFPWSILFSSCLQLYSVFVLSIAAELFCKLLDFRGPGRGELFLHKANAETTIKQCEQSTSNEHRNEQASTKQMVRGAKKADGNLSTCPHILKFASANVPADKRSFLIAQICSHRLMLCGCIRMPLRKCNPIMVPFRPPPPCRLKLIVTRPIATCIRKEIRQNCCFADYKDNRAGTS